MGDEYTILEEPIGLVQLPDTFANTLVTAIKDVLRRCNLPLALCRGQAYNGAANMQGVRNGVATQIQAKVPSAISLHYLAHCLQLVLQEAGRKCGSLREALELVREIVKLIKLSPKRSALFVQNFFFSFQRVSPANQCCHDTGELPPGLMTKILLISLDALRITIEYNTMKPVTELKRN